MLSVHLYNTNQNNSIDTVLMSQKGADDRFLRMDEGRIASSVDYLLMHIMNDMERIKDYTSLNMNKNDINRWMSIVIGYVGKNMIDRVASNDSINIDIHKMYSDSKQLVGSFEGKLLDRKKTKNLKTKEYKDIINGVYQFDESMEDVRYMKMIDTIVGQYKFDTGKVNKAIEEFNLCGYRLLKMVIDHKDFLKYFGKMMSSLLDLIKYISIKYRYKISLKKSDETCMSKVVSKDSQMKKLYEEYCDHWSQVNQDKVLQVIDRFDYQCHQNVDISNLMKKSIEIDKCTLSMFMMIDGVDDGEKYFVKSLIQSMIKKVHNEYVNNIYRVLNPHLSDEGTGSYIPQGVISKSVMECTFDDYIQVKDDLDIIKIYMDHCRFRSTDRDGMKRSDYVIDYEKVEKEVAKRLAKNKISAESSDIEFIKLVHHIKNTDLDIDDIDSNEVKYHTEEGECNQQFVGLVERLVLQSNENSRSDIRSIYSMLFDVYEYISVSSSIDPSLISPSSTISNTIIASLDEGGASYDELLERIKVRHMRERTIYIHDIVYIMRYIRSHDIEAFIKKYGSERVEGYDDGVQLDQDCVDTMMDEMYSKICRIYPMDNMMNDMCGADNTMKSYIKSCIDLGDDESHALQTIMYSNYVWLCDKYKRPVIPGNMI